LAPSHLHHRTIEAAENPADESWRNIVAMDDFVLEILNTMSHLTIAALRGNAGAGGALMALAPDRVYARSGVVLNPHYKGMGGLYGSEYWTYTLPRRVGRDMALHLTQSCAPLGTREAKAIGLIDDAFGADIAEFETQIRTRAEALAQGGDCWNMLKQKRERRLADERDKPLATYRQEELAQMRLNFYGSNPSYHEARGHFVSKRPTAYGGSHPTQRSGVQEGHGGSDVPLTGEAAQPTLCWSNERPACRYWSHPPN
jgi:putative two-component system hydrogenase maturation factor HypX/HoxX